MAARKTHFSVGTKILLVAASFALPIVVLTYYVVSTINAGIQFASLELAGNRYQRALEAVLEPLTQHHLTHHLCYTRADCATQLTPLNAAVDAAFVKLVAVDRELGQALQFTDAGLGKRKRADARVDKVAARWQVFQATAMGSLSSGTMPDEVNTQYDALLQDLRTMITHVGDTSNLILDPDLDSYYLMDVTLLALPQTQDRIVKLGRLGIDALARDPVDADARTQMVIGAALMREADYERISSSTQTAINEDGNFHGSSKTLASTVLPATAQYRQAADNFMAQLSPAAGGSSTVAMLGTASLAASAASFQLWGAASRELDALLRARLATLESSKWSALGISAMALLIACLLAWLVTRSITRPLRTARRTLAPGADLLTASVRRISEITHRPKADLAETTIICEELDAQAAEMRDVVLDLVAQVRGSAARNA